MRKWIIALTALALAVVSAPGAGAGDEEDVRKIAEAWVAGWDSGDMEALGALYADDADMVDFTGQTTKGREAIQAAFGELNSTIYKGSKLSVNIVSVTFPKPGIAVLDDSWKLTDVPAGGPDVPTEGQATVIAVKVGDTWKITAHRTRVPGDPVVPE